MGQLIERLWDCDFEYVNYSDPVITESLKLSNETRKRLEGTLSIEQQKLFDEYYKYLSEYHCRIEKNAFSNGFSLGFRLSSEAFADSEKILNGDRA